MADPSAPQPSGSPMFKVFVCGVILGLLVGLAVGALVTPLLEDRSPTIKSSGVPKIGERERQRPTTVEDKPAPKPEDKAPAKPAETPATTPPSTPPSGPPAPAPGGGEQKNP